MSLYRIKGNGHHVHQSGGVIPKIKKYSNLISNPRTGRTAMTVSVFIIYRVAPTPRFAPGQGGHTKNQKSQMLLDFD